MPAQGRKIMPDNLAPNNLAKSLPERSEGSETFARLNGRRHKEKRAPAIRNPLHSSKLRNGELLRGDSSGFNSLWLVLRLLFFLILLRLLRRSFAGVEIEIGRAHV